LPLGGAALAVCAALTAMMVATNASTVNTRLAFAPVLITVRSAALVSIAIVMRATVRPAGSRHIVATPKLDPKLGNRRPYGASASARPVRPGMPSLR
jgi:hypothetical protein